MAEQHTITVKVTGDSSQLVQALNRAQNELNQLDRSTNGAIGGMDDLARASLGTGSALGSMGGMLASVGWAGAIAGAVALGSELYNVGRASQVALNTFTQLQGGADKASASLALMQEATNFTVPDTTLMSISNLYTQMGLATNPTEVARLAQMGATLGQAMGSSAEEAMRTFSQLLANQSIELLDTFGISSGKVRERIEELQDANKGLARDQAFVTAVLEEGAFAMERLGDATEQNVSAVGQLTTRFQNLMAEMGKPVAGAIESVAGGINDALTQLDELDAMARQMASTSQRFALPITQQTNEDDLIRIARMTAVLVDETGSYEQALEELYQQFTNPAIQQQITLLEGLVRAQELATRQVTSGYGFDFGAPSGALAEQRRLEETARIVDLITASVGSYGDELNRFKEGALSGLLSQSEIESATAMASYLTKEIDELTSISPDNPTIKTLQQMQTELQGIADTASKAREEMNLATALGLGLDPNQRMTADILGRAGIEGRTAEYLTGQRTQLSELFDMNILPLIQGVESQFGEDEAAQLGDRIAKLMQEGIARGMQNNPTDLISFVMANAGYQMQGEQVRSVIVRAGQTLTEIARAEGVTVELLAEINNLANPNMILAGQELVVDVGARVTRILPPEASLTTDQLMQEMGVMQAPTVQGEGEEPVSVFGAESLGLSESLTTAQELQTTLVETEPPLLTPSRFGLVSGDVAEVGVVEIVDMIGEKLKSIAGTQYRVNMTVDLDANIRTGAGFKIIPITMTEIANDISQSDLLYQRGR